VSKFFQTFLIFLTFFSVIFCTRKNETGIEYSGFNTKKYTLLKKEYKIKYLDSVIKHFHSTHNDSLDKLKYFDLSNEYYSLNEYLKSIQASKKALQLSKLTNDSLSIGKAFSYIGDCYLLDNKDSAYYFYHQAEKLYLKLKIKEKLALMLFKKAYLLMIEGGYSESEIQVTKSLKLLKGTKNYQLLFSAYTVLGIDFEKLEEYDNALKYHLSAQDVLRVLQKNGKDFDSQFNYNLSTAINLSNTYEKLGDYKKAIAELSLLINDETKEKWPKEYSIILNDIGNIKMKSGDLKGVNTLFFKALEISKKNNFEDNIVYECINLGEYFYKINDFTNSKYYLKKALTLSQKIKATDEIKTALRLLVKVDTTNRYFYDERYITISDSLVKAQRKSREKYARIEYETSVVEDENKMLSAKNTYILIGALISIFTLITVIVYRHIKSQKREIEFRKAQQKAEEEIFDLLKEYQLKLSISKELEQNRISKELHDSVMNKLYGARMQLGILNNSDVKEIKEKRLGYVDLLQEIEQEIRTISHDLQSEIIDNQFDYIPLLSNLIQLQNEIGTTLFSFEVDPNIDWDAIDSLVKITIFRIVQESLLNVTKHAKSTLCNVSVSLEANHLILLIKDDGVGFDVNATKKGIGLQNIQERVKTIKAALEISSISSKGTSIKLKAKIGNL
jgi:signal transduction histidine kinase